MIKCSKCGATLDQGDREARIAFICGSVMGDEYIESYYFCEPCQVYTVEVYHDRFSGEDSISTEGPMEKARGDKKIEIIRRCPEPSSKRCRCPAHQEYFGNWLD